MQRWQKISEPVYRWLFAGLSLTRDIPALLEEGGFQIDQIEARHLAEFPKSPSHCWWGTATHAG